MLCLRMIHNAQCMHIVEYIVVSVINEDFAHFSWFKICTTHIFALTSVHSAFVIFQRLYWCRLPSSAISAPVSIEPLNVSRSRIIAANLYRVYSLHYCGSWRTQYLYIHHTIIWATSLTLLCFRLRSLMLGVHACMHTALVNLCWPLSYTSCMMTPWP